MDEFLMDEFLMDEFLMDESPDTYRRPIFRQPITARLAALLCYAKITPNAGEPAWPG
jgi:hypothetical protein